MKNVVKLEHYYFPGELTEGGTARLRRVLQQRAIPRSSRQRDTRRCLLRAAVQDHHGAREDQETNDAQPEEGVPGQQGGLGMNPKLSLS